MDQTQNIASPQISQGYAPSASASPAHEQYAPPPSASPTVQVYAPPPSASPMIQQYAPPPSASPMIQQYAPPPSASPVIQQYSPPLSDSTSPQQYIPPSSQASAPLTYVPSPGPMSVQTPSEQYNAQQQPINTQYYIQQQPQQVIQPASGPNYTVTVAPSAEPELTIIRGNGLKSHLPQLKFCCFCFPLDRGAIALAAVTMILYAIYGLIMIVGGSVPKGTYQSAIVIVLGVGHLICAGFHGYGVAACTREDIMMVKRYVRGFIGISIIWFLMEIAYMAIVVSYVSQCYFCTFNWALWIVLMLIGITTQVFFCACLVSYERLLAARHRAKEGINVGELGAAPVA